MIRALKVPSLKTEQAPGSVVLYALPTLPWFIKTKLQKKERKQKVAINTQRKRR